MQEALGPRKLDGIWEFAFFPGTLEKFQVAKTQFSGKCTVPGCFDLLPECRLFRGTGAYRKTVTAGGMCRLSLGGIGLRAKVFWDGRGIFSTEIPFALQKVDFDAGKSGSHELVIACCNEFDRSDRSMFRPNYDFYAHGGIFRSVTLEPLAEMRIERLAVTAADLKGGKVRISVKLAGRIPQKCTAAFSFDGSGKVASVILRGGSGEYELAVPGFRIWSPASPNLHSLTLSVPGAERTVRFGLRTVGVKRGKILLNGQTLKILGFNRHDAHPDFGYAVPQEIRLRDLLMLKQTGCNFIRGCHYPQSDEFLDLCDELGILVWEESMGWGNAVSNLTDPEFRRLQLEQTRLMVEKSINHPSVVLWGFLNEAQTDSPEAVPVISEQAALIRKLDPSRPVTFATCRGVNDRCLESVDVISFNTYPGWYGGENQYFDPAAVKADLSKLEKFAGSGKYRNKALILSEIGAEAFPGDHSGLRWSEDYQAELARTVREYVGTHPRWSGVLYWMFSDTRSYEGEFAACRARGFNNKGFVTEHRLPKKAWLDLLEEERRRASGK